MAHRSHLSACLWGSLLASLLACAPEPGLLHSEIEPGLRMTGADQATTQDHLVEILVHQGHVYAANSGFGVSTMRLDDDGALTLTDPGVSLDDFVRCTTLALHAASNTLYCGADAPPFDPKLEIYDLSQPGAPVLHDPLPLPIWGVRDIEIVGETLLFNGFDEGLWQASIAADGSLGPIEPTGVEGNVRFSVAVGDRVITALAQLEGPGTELRLLDPATWTELDRLELEGPALGLSAADGQPALAVALGSMGMAIVDVDVAGDQLQLRRTLQPPAVVTHGLLAGDLAIVVTLSGAFGYTLSDDRLFGFAPESTAGYQRSGNMLHAVLHEGELFTSDWTWVERWAITPDGEAVGLDVPRGLYLPPDVPARWRMRNLSNVDLRAEFWFRKKHKFDVMVPAHSANEYQLSAEDIQIYTPKDDPRLHFNIRIHDPAVDREGEPLAISTFMILTQTPDRQAPPVGTSFPPVVLAGAEDQVFTLPQPGQATRTVWYSPDCALMWPELEDLAWQVRHGRSDLMRGTPVLISFADPYYSFIRRWGLDGIATGLYGADAPPEVDAANVPKYGEDLLGAFVIADLPGDGLTTDYEIDGGGRVVSIERMYRGPWPLVGP